MVPTTILTCPPSFFQPRPQQAYQHPPPPQNSGPSLEEIVKTLAFSTLQFQQETRTSIRNLETQVSQLANIVARIEAQGLVNLPLKL